MPELSRPLPLVAVGAAGRVECVVADASERAALAARFGILGIDRLEATLRLTPARDDVVLVRGTLVAAVVQACVVTFEPVAQSIEEAVHWRLLPAGLEPVDGPEDADEIPTDGVADLGEAVAEQLSLALDPYPRVDGAMFEQPDLAAASGAFAALGRLRTDG